MYLQLYSYANKLLCLIYNQENPFQEAERQADLRRQEEMARPSDGRAYNRLDETDSDSENETQTQNRGTGLLCLNETIAAERADSSDGNHYSLPFFIYI